jgi:hypothetical protein
MPRLVRRSILRIVHREELWGGSRETISNAFLRREGLLRFAWRAYGVRRATYPSEHARFHVVRLRSRREVDERLTSVAQTRISADEATRSPPPRDPRRDQ